MSLVGKGILAVRQDTRQLERHQPTDDADADGALCHHSGVTARARMRPYLIDLRIRWLDEALPASMDDLRLVDRHSAGPFPILLSGNR